MRKLVTFLIICVSALFFHSCNDDTIDLCDGIVCVNGSCVSGDCDCDEGWTGSSCSDQITPSLIEVTAIKVTRFPATADGGAGWDPFSGPDIYVDIKYNDILGLTTTYYEDADPSQDYTFTGGQIEIVNYIDNLTGQYTINLMDYDLSVLDSDWMGGINFSPYSSNNGFPTTKILDAGGSVAFELTLSYTW